MKKIDDIIKKNRELFDSEEPNDGHFERFNTKLKNANIKILKINTWQILKVASIVILIVLSSLWVFDNLLSKSSKQLYTLGEISPEYKEIEEYYLNTINTNYNQIQEFKFDDESQKKMLLNELKEMDSIYVSLQKDLKRNPNDERIISAMINHYQLKAEVLNNILNQLKQINNQINNTSHENTEI